MRYHHAMSPESPQNEQLKLDFETVHGALCYDGTMPSGKEIFKQDLTPIDEETFTNAAGDVYERAVPRGDGVDRFVLKEKADVPDEVRAEMERVAKELAGKSWVDYYNVAKTNIALREKGWPHKSEPLDPMLR